MKALFVGMGVFGLLCLAAPSRAEEGKVELKLVKYDELTKLLADQKGKVVVIDFWADTWITCKKEFPHLVEMHEKYAKNGLAAFSCALDDPNGKNIKDKLLKFLKEKKATFQNFLLDETSDDWQEKLKIDGPPAVFVFDRDGTPAKKFTENFTYADVEKLVVELMNKK